MSGDDKGEKEGVEERIGVERGGGGGEGGGTLRKERAQSSCGRLSKCVHTVNPMHVVFVQIGDGPINVSQVRVNLRVGKLS